MRLENDRATLSLDSSGVPLYKRGIKQGAARAPIRETLAAAVLMAAGYDGSRPHVPGSIGERQYRYDAGGHQLGWLGIEGGVALFLLSTSCRDDVPL